MGFPEPNPIQKCLNKAERDIMNIKVIAYEDTKRGVYKYSLLKGNETETHELQRFIKNRKIDLDVKVEVKEISLPEKETVTTITFSPEKEHEIIVVLQGPQNGAVIFSDHPVIEHSASSFLSWIISHRSFSLKEISEITFYTKGLCELLEFVPYAWSGTDTALLAIEEK